MNPDDEIRRMNPDDGIRRMNMNVGKRRVNLDDHRYSRSTDGREKRVKVNHLILRNAFSHPHPEAKL